MKDSPWVNDEFARKNISHIDSHFHAGTVQEVDFIITELSLERESRIIDLGCGTGRHSIQIAKKGYSVVGIDISDVLLSEANKRAAEAHVSIDFIRGDVRSINELLAGEKGTFDGAICLCESAFGELGGVREDVQFLKNICGILSKNRKCILTTFNAIRRYRKYEIHDEAFDITKGIIRWHGPAEEYGKDLQDETRIYTPSEIMMLFDMAGFIKTKIYGCSPGDFSRRTLAPDDIEMMVIAVK